MDANSARTTHRKTGLPTWQVINRVGDSCDNTLFYRREGVPLHSRGCPEGLLKRGSLEGQSSRPPSGVPRATLCIEQMTAADGLLNRRQEEEPMDWDDVPSLPEVSAPFVFPVPHGR
ncbi:hypothetical protein TNCV_2548851 [Trichonephila clavipes]|nr:hypothetical protein TNCV_2548851 [Trichonephila clavipes]